MFLSGRVGWERALGHAHLALTDSPELQDASVRPEHRRRGIASILTEAASARPAYAGSMASHWQSLSTTPRRRSCSDRWAASMLAFHRSASRHDRDPYRPDRSRRHAPDLGESPSAQPPV